MIRYPFELSKVSIDNTIGFGEQATFALNYRNVSSRDLGLNSDSKRRLKIVIEVVGGVSGSDLMFIGQTIDDKHKLDNPFIQEIEFQPAKSEGSFSGTFAFCHPDIAPFSSAELRASLFIGSLEKQEVYKIQERNFSIQYSIDFEGNPEADFILITNTQTTAI